MHSYGVFDRDHDDPSSGDDGRVLIHHDCARTINDSTRPQLDAEIVLRRFAAIVQWCWVVRLNVVASIESDGSMILTIDDPDGTTIDDQDDRLIQLAEATCGILIRYPDDSLQLESCCGLHFPIALVGDAQIC